MAAQLSLRHTAYYLCHPGGQGSRGSGRQKAREEGGEAGTEGKGSELGCNSCKWNRPPNSRLIQPFLELGGWHEEGVEHGHTLGQHGDLQFMLCLEEGEGRQQCHGGGRPSKPCLHTLPAGGMRVREGPHLKVVQELFERHLLTVRLQPLDLKAIPQRPLLVIVLRDKDWADGLQATTGSGPVSPVLAVPPPPPSLRLTCLVRLQASFVKNMRLLLHPEH